MARLHLALVCALAALLVAPQAAAGGGWWAPMNVSRSTVAPGQDVEVAVRDVMFRSVAAAEEAQENGRYYVYLLRGFDYSLVERAMRVASPRNWWSLGDADAIRVGELAVRVSDANLARATGAFTVPELPPATYRLMLCDAGCAEPLPDVIPAAFTIVADPATAQIAQRTDRVERRIYRQGLDLRRARAAADRAEQAARDADSEIEQLKGEVSRLAEADEAASPVAWPAYSGWFLAGVLAGALALITLRRRRLRRAAAVAAWHPSDEELRELLSSEAANRR